MDGDKQVPAYRCNPRYGYGQTELHDGAIRQSAHTISRPSTRHSPNRHGEKKTVQRKHHEYLHNMTPIAEKGRETSADLTATIAGWMEVQLPADE